MKPMPVYVGIVAVSTALFCVSPPYAAEGAAVNGEGLDEIVVTAQRREESLSNVPVSVVVFSQEKMDQQGIRNIDDLSRLTPGLTFIRNGSSNSFNDEQSNISIRGIFSSAGAATTGLYIDDTPIQTRHLSFGTADPYPVLFDLDRVEVLRGPQGTLFGAGSEGGTVRFIRPEPNLTTFQGFSRAEVGQLDNGGLNYDAGAAFGGPIIPGTLAFRVSAFYREEGGWVNRVTYTTEPTTGNPLPVATGVTERNANWRDTYALNAALKWAPVDELTVQPSLFVQSLHINDTAMYWKSLSSPDSGQYNNGNLNRDASTDPFYLVALKVNWSLPFGDLVSNTSYFHRKEHALTDFTQWVNTVYFNQPFPSAANYVNAYNEDNQNNITQEIRMSSKDPQARLTWTGGVFLSHVSENQPEILVGPGVIAQLGYGPVPGNIAQLQPTFNIVDKQAAVFGEVGFKLTDAWKATVGLRAAHVQYSGAVQQSGPLLGGVTVNSANSSNENPITPRFVLSYQYNEDSLYYASAAKGYRPGGLNATLPAICTGDLPVAVPQTFQSDSLWQYELGTKQTLFDRTFQVNASVYYLKWKNIQQLVYLACGLGFSPNVGEVTGRGADIEARFRASSDLTLGLQAAYTDTYYTGTVSLANLGQSVNLVTAGDHLPGSPLNIDASAEYVVNAISQKPYLRIDYQYATAQKSPTPLQDPSNVGSDPTELGLPLIRVLGLRAGIRLNGLDLSVFAQNALNYNTATFVYRDSQSPQDTNYMLRGIAPRTVGVTATYRY